MILRGSMGRSVSPCFGLVSNFLFGLGAVVVSMFYSDQVDNTKDLLKSNSELKQMVEHAEHVNAPRLLISLRR